MSSSFVTPNTQVFPDDTIYIEPFHPSTSKLLYLLNSNHYDKELRSAIDASSERNRAFYSCLLFLRGQRRQITENLTQLDRHMGILAQHIVNDEAFTVTGAIAIPRPSLDIVNLPLHVVISNTDPDGDRFATDEDVSPNDPVFLCAIIRH
ncbi:hypothetical protein Moror_9321 [Moniliophthora roreri MCA 2997]|uniref:Uncharacterized protein n=2 Tax=Moniliophthora roreri TaxID=221103 RepID=V2Y3D0_MONRO|nr:hypothetical protein Moror_9321 [Moniliophthora roreri MCA 2997]